MIYLDMICNQAVCLINSFYNKVSEVIGIHIPIKQLSKQELKVDPNHG